MFEYFCFSQKHKQSSRFWTWILPHIKKWCEVLWARRYIQYRHKLSKHYKVCIKARLDPRQRPYKTIGNDVWQSLCDYFESEGIKRRYEANVDNRNEQLYGHISGSKSFAEIYVEKENLTEESPGRIEINRETRCRPNGEWVSQVAESHYDKMLDMWQQSRQEGQSHMSEDEICDTVLGTRPGYIKGLGPGPRPSGSRVVVPPTFVEVVKDLEEENKTLKIQMEELKALVMQMTSATGATGGSRPTDGAENTD